MSSIIEGYNYDIFISYRQKDNKHDGWVTEFVDNLKGELEATFKEEISVYFDINPHDGLLETHDVDASLKDKLKCLVFIPIVSRTYCDPKSFAWEHEFKAFVEEASKDQFGLKVKLPNGNVASRMIPVQIHDLYPEDKALIEKELGGFLRAVEFIYKEPGVNRPLTASDEKETNLNKTFYKNQINKVANAIDEVIHSLKYLQAAPMRETRVSAQSLGDKLEEDKPLKKAGRTFISKNPKKWLMMSSSIILLIAGVFAVYKIIQNNQKNIDIDKLEKSIAVLPFTNDSPDQENTYFINGLMDEILNNLQKIKDFRVLSRTSTEQYRVTNKPTIPRIAKELGVSYIIEGSGQTYGNKFRLRVQLIRAKGKETHLWAESYERELKGTSDLFSVQSKIAESIAEELKTTITPKEKQLIEKVPTADLTAYDFYQKGRDEHMKYWLGGENKRLVNAISYYKLALKYDSTFAQAYTGLAMARINSYWTNVYTRMTFSESDLKLVNDSVLSLVDKALNYNNKLDEAYMIRGWCSVDADIKLKEFKIALEINPNYSLAYYNIGGLLFSPKCDIIEGFKNYLKAIALERGPFLPYYLKDLGTEYECYGFNANAIDIYNQKFQLTKDTLQYYQDIDGPYYADRNWKEAIRWGKRILEKDSSHLWALNQLASIYSFLGKTDSVVYYLKKAVATDSCDYCSKFNQGLLLWITGNKKEVKLIFDKVIEFTENLVTSGIDINSNALILAQIYSMEGNQKRAMDYFKMIKGSWLSEGWFIIVMENDPILQNLRTNNEFQKILRTSKSDWQNEHDKIQSWLEKNHLLKL